MGTEGKTQQSEENREALLSTIEFRQPALVKASWMIQGMVLHFSGTQNQMCAQNKHFRGIGSSELIMNNTDYQVLLEVLSIEARAYRIREFQVRVKAR